MEEQQLDATKLADDKVDFVYGELQQRIEAQGRRAEAYLSTGRYWLTVLGSVLVFFASNVVFQSIDNTAFSYLTKHLSSLVKIFSGQSEKVSITPDMYITFIIVSISIVTYFLTVLMFFIMSMVSFMLLALRSKHIYRTKKHLNEGATSVEYLFYAYPDAQTLMNCDAEKLSDMKRKLIAQMQTMIDSNAEHLEKMAFRMSQSNWLLIVTIWMFFAFSVMLYTYWIIDIFATKLGMIIAIVSFIFYFIILLWNRSRKGGLYF